MSGLRLLIERKRLIAETTAERNEFFSIYLYSFLTIRKRKKRKKRNKLKERQRKDQQFSLHEACLQNGAKPDEQTEPGTRGDERQVVERVVGLPDVATNNRQRREQRRSTSRRRARQLSRNEGPSEDRAARLVRANQPRARQRRKQVSMTCV